MLQISLYGGCEIGVDEAGRGPLAGSVFAGAVLLPADFFDARLDDSKRMKAADRHALRAVIEREALGWCVAQATAAEIDSINILHATFLAMERAVIGLCEGPTGDLAVGRKAAPAVGLEGGPSSGLAAVDRLLIDGNRFRTSLTVPYECIVKGDGKLAPIAAASVLAKTHRDEYMLRLHEEYPLYGWDRNMAYPTAEHRAAIAAHGPTPHHRMSFKLIKD